MKNFYKYLIFFIFGIIIYFLLNNRDKFNVGIQSGPIRFLPDSYIMYDKYRISVGNHNNLKTYKLVETTFKKHPSKDLYVKYIYYPVYYRFGGLNQRNSTGIPDDRDFETIKGELRWLHRQLMNHHRDISESGGVFESMSFLKNAMLSKENDNDYDLFIKGNDLDNDEGLHNYIDRNLIEIWRLEKKIGIRFGIKITIPTVKNQCVVCPNCVKEMNISLIGIMPKTITRLIQIYNNRVASMLNLVSFRDTIFNNIDKDIINSLVPEGYWDTRSELWNPSSGADQGDGALS